MRITTRDHRVEQIMNIKREQDRNWRSLRNAGDQVGPFSERFPDGCWNNQRCFIIGGGPSLKGFDFSRLRGERVIAINKAFLDVPFADIMFAMDRPLLDLITSGKLGENYRQAFEFFWGAKLWLDLSGYSYPAGIYHLPAAGEIGWTKSTSQGLFHGQNSGYGALNLAMVLGADPIYLLGYDCSKGPAGEKNYHSGYLGGGNPDAVNIFLKAFNAGKTMLEGRPRIVNLNPQSALRCFEFGDVDKVLSVKPKSNGPTITVITPTGDRPLAFALCQQWMAHQTRKPDQWIVIDDGKIPLEADLVFLNSTMPGVAIGIRREPRADDPKHTLDLNLKAALPLITGNKILIMEDDEYYAPGYIEEMARQLDFHEIVGIRPSKYYHLPSGGYLEMRTPTHASLAETAFRNSFLSELNEIIKGNGETGIDFKIWTKAGNRGFIFADGERPIYLGIKGLPGRGGIGIGHNPANYHGVTDTPDRTMLRRWVPKDYQVYLDILSGKLTSENYKSYFSPDLPITGITVCWNTKELIERAYNSIRKFHPDMPIIIIDGSDPGDPCAAYVRGLASDITTVISLGYNIGHGRGMCLGIEKAKTKYALMFDSDIEMLKSPIEAMLAMMEEDTFGVGDVDEKADFSRFAHGQYGQVEGPVRYLQPCFQLINISNYKKFYPYVHHGAPCYLTMLDIHKRGLSGKILKHFPGLPRFSDDDPQFLHGIHGEYIRHDKASTRRFRTSKRLPDIEGAWVLNEGLV